MKGIAMLSNWFTCGIVFTSLFFGLEAVMKIHSVEELCSGRTAAVIDIGYENSGVLTSTRSETPINCRILIRPRLRESTVLSINTYNLHPEDDLIIEDSEKYKVRLLGFGFFPNEAKSILSDGSITIHYTSNSTLYPNDKLKFKFIFTQTTEGPCLYNEFECRNKRCIKDRLVCDNHNHCGDRSDQENCGPVHDKSFRSTDVPEVITVNNRTGVWVISIVVGGVILGIVVIVFVAVAIRKSVKKKDNPEPAQSSTPHDSDGSNLPTTSVAVSMNPSNMQPRPHIAEGSSNQFHNLPTAPVASSPNPTLPSNQPRPSYFTQIRRSISSKINTPKVETKKEEEKSENYQVPSMYPQLPPDSQAMENPNNDHKQESHHQAPSMYPNVPPVSHSSGVDNPDFKADE